MIDYPKERWKRRRPKKRTPLSEVIKQSVFSLMVALTVINVFLMAIFLIYMSDTSQKGYVLKQSQEKNDGLVMKQKVLESKLIELRKYSTLENSDVVRKMEPATEENFNLVDNS